MMLGYSECESISELLWNYAAQRIAEDQAKRVEAHILVCSTCRKEVEAYRLAVGAINGLKQSPVPASRANWHDLQARLTATPTRQPLFSVNSLRIPALAWGSLAVASVLGVFFFSRPFDENIAIHRTPGREVVKTAPADRSENNTASTDSDLDYDDIVENDAELLPAAKTPATKAPAGHYRSVVERHAPHITIRWSRVTYTHNEVRSTRPLRRNVSRIVPDYDAIDGGRSSGNVDNENFVLTPVTSPMESEAPSNYVMGSLATRIRPVSSSYDTDDTEAHGW